MIENVNTYLFCIIHISIAIYLLKCYLSLVIYYFEQIENAK